MNEAVKIIPFKEIGTGKVSITPYISKEHFEREKEVIWRSNWLLAGRESEIAEKNDYMVFDLAVLSMSVLITRARDGKIRAFHNVCKHRGHKLCNKTSGNSKSHVCPFHSWAYDPEGQLRGIPWEETFPEGVDREDAALTPITVDTWGGFVFVHVNPEPKFTLKEYLNGFPEPMEAYLRERDWRWFGGNSYMVDHNWKLGVEGNECYHAGSLHNTTVAAPVGPDQVEYTLFDSPGVLSRETLYLPKEMPLTSDEGFDGLGMEQMMEAMRTPIEMLAAKYSKLSGFSGKDAALNASPDYPGTLNHKNDPRWIFDGYYLFPNHFIIHQKDEFHLFTLWPVDVDKSIYHWDSFQVGEQENFGELFGEMQKVIFSGEVTPEDVYAAECMQKSFNSGAIDSVYVCDGEVNVRAFQKRSVEGM